MTNAEARCNKSLRPRKPEGSLGRTAQDVHLDSHTAPELWVNTQSTRTVIPGPQRRFIAQQLCESQGGRPGLSVPNSPYGLSAHKSTWNLNWSVRAQELCESRGGRPGLSVPNSPYGLCGRKATLSLNQSVGT